jgi:hypothetical protein
MNNRPEIEIAKKHGLALPVRTNGETPDPPEDGMPTEDPYQAQHDQGLHEPPVPDQDQTKIDQRYLQLLGQVIDIDGLRKITPPTSLIDGYLYRDSLVWLGGKPGHGKTRAVWPLQRPGTATPPLKAQCCI